MRNVIDRSRIHSPAMHAFRQRLFAWIAMFAMLVSALAPAVSRAMGPDENGRYFIELCSAEGSSLISLTAAEAALYGDHVIPAGDGEGDESAMLENCAYCAAPFNSAMLPPAGSPPVFATAGSLPAPLLFFVSPRPLFAWSPAHPRAPPARA